MRTMHECEASEAATTDGVAERVSAHGICALSGLLSTDQLALLRRQCDERRSALSTEELCEADCVLEATCLPPEQHPARTDAASYLALRSAPSDFDELHALLFGKLAAIASMALQARPLLFNEHFVCKPHTAGAFQWHTDAAHQLEAIFSLRPPPASDDGGLDYVSLWISLDDLNEDNGPLVLLPLSVQQPSSPWHEPADAHTEQWLEEHASHLLSTSALRAGDAVLFSSRVWHCSAPNWASRDRRVFYCQFSRRVIGVQERPLALAIHTDADAGCLAESTRIVSLLPLVTGSRLASTSVSATGTDEDKNDTLEVLHDNKRQRRVPTVNVDGSARIERFCDSDLRDEHIPPP